MNRIRVTVCALDPVTRAGLNNCLQPSADLMLNEDFENERTDIVVAAFGKFTSVAVAKLRAIATRSSKPIVLLMDDVNEGDLTVAAQCGVVEILPRIAATDGRLPHQLRVVASGTMDIWAEMTQRLLTQAERLHREAATTTPKGSAGFTGREIDVLRLMAEGLETGEIAQKLRYSERTVTNVLHKMTSRLGLRNRQHAVAQALRSGVI